MGRVKRYKKIKAIDPFSKRKPNTGNSSSSHDDPPNMRAQKSHSKHKKRIYDQENFPRKDKNEEEEEAEPEKEAPRLKHIDPKLISASKRETDETVKEYAKRIRSEARKKVHSVVSQMSATVNRKKEKLKQKKEEKKTKKEEKKEGDKDYDKLMTNPDPEANKVFCWNTVVQPPDLKSWTDQLKKASAKSLLRQSPAAASAMMGNNAGVGAINKLTSSGVNNMVYNEARSMSSF